MFYHMTSVQTSYLNCFKNVNVFMPTIVFSALKQLRLQCRQKPEESYSKAHRFHVQWAKQKKSLLSRLEKNIPVFLTCWGTYTHPDPEISPDWQYWTGLNMWLISDSFHKVSHASKRVEYWAELFALSISLSFSLFVRVCWLDVDSFILYVLIKY